MKITNTEPLCSVGTRQRFRKILLFAMRAGLFYILCIIGSIQLLLAAHEGNGQNIETTYVTIELQNEDLLSLFDKIKKSTDLRFTFNQDEVKRYTDISLPRAKRSVKEVLDLVLGKTSLTYQQLNGDMILVFGKNGEEEIGVVSGGVGNVEAEVLNAFTVTGTVTDAANQQPLAGVNVIVKGTTRGTTTDAGGKFSIDAEDSDVLVFTFIGFKSFEAQVSGRSVIDVGLEEDATALQEVVVNAGYWNVKDRENTGNISQVTSEEIEKQPVSNPLEALSGRMTGVYIQQTTGVSGGNINVQIRGRNSLRSGANRPLYIIDGVPFTSETLTSVGGSIIPGASPFNNFNPSDIESIEILKDADATAIYGSRGANGVVLITTKKGKSGATKIDLNVYQGIGKVTKFEDLLNTDQYMVMRREAFKNDNASPQSWDVDLSNWDTTRYTDWQKELIGGTSHVTNAQASVSGGNSDTQFLFSLGYFRQSTVFPGDFADQKGSVHFNFNHDALKKKLNISFSSSYVIDNNNLLEEDLTNYTRRLPPNAPAIYDENGTLNWENSTWFNPFSILQRTYEIDTKNLVLSTLLSYEIVNNLKIKSSFGYTNAQTDELKKTPLSSFNPEWGVTSGYSDFGTASSNTWVVEPQFEYEKTIGRGKLTALIGLTFQESRLQKKYIQAFGFSSDALLENILIASDIYVAAYNDTQYRYSAAFGRINYNWEDKYVINITARRDGSSRFGPDNRLANFGAVGAAWIFSNEDFINSNLKFLSFGKIRTSYGTTGSDQIPDYGYLNTFSATRYQYQGLGGLVPTRLVNPDFAWESNRKLEGAIELGFIDDRIFLSASFYRNESSSQLVGYSLPTTTGFNTVLYNLPAKVRNSGVELEVTSNNLRKGNFTWTTSFNISIPQNKLISYPNIEGSSYANTYEVGKSLFTIKQFSSTGVDPQTGLYTIEDIDENGSFTYADYKAKKELGQDYFGGFHNSLTFHGFQLDIFFQFVKQTGRAYMSYYGMPGYMSNQPTDVMNRWRTPGDISNIQKFSQDSGASAFNLASESDSAITDASFVRLKNLSLSYQFPSSLTKRLKLRNFRVYALGQNLITITDYIGSDPEHQNYYFLPPLRTLTLGLNFTL